MLNIVNLQTALTCTLNTRPVQTKIWIWNNLLRFPISGQQVCQTFALALAEMRHVFINSARASERNGDIEALPTPGNIESLTEQRAEFTNYHEAIFRI